MNDKVFKPGSSWMFMLKRKKYRERAKGWYPRNAQLPLEFKTSGTWILTHFSDCKSSEQNELFRRQDATGPRGRAEETWRFQVDQQDISAFSGTQMPGHLQSMSNHLHWTDNLRKSRSGHLAPDTNSCWIWPLWFWMLLDLSFGSGTNN